MNNGDRQMIERIADIIRDEAFINIHFEIENAEKLAEMILKALEEKEMNDA
jgi:hypothetical protein